MPNRGVELSSYQQEFIVQMSDGLSGSKIAELLKLNNCKNKFLNDLEQLDKWKIRKEVGDHDKQMTGQNEGSRA